MDDLDLPVPPEFEFLEDVSAADWVLERLEPWDRNGVRVASFLPDGYEAYVRIPNRWPSPDDAFLDEGSLPQVRVEALIEILADFSASAPATLLHWTGWGDWSESSKAVLSSRGKDPTWLSKKRERRRAARDAAQDRIALNAIPRVHAHARDYFAFRAPLSMVSRFEIAGHYRSPSLWWADDRVWCVATEVDSRYTFVGASRVCIEAIKACAPLEAADATPDDPIAPRRDGDSPGH